VTFWRIVAARAVRNAAYGWLSVVLAIAVAARGLDAAGVGAFLTVALLSGAVFSLATGALVTRLGQRATLILAAFAMAVSGALLALAQHSPALLVAALLGTLSPGGQEVGPFGAIEQAALGMDSSGETMQRFAIYNLVASAAAALGALVVSFVPVTALLWGYAAAGLVLAALYTTFSNPPAAPRDVDAVAKASAQPEQLRKPERRRNLRFGTIERLALLFGVDALAGGFVIQSFIAYWLRLRFGVDAHALGVLFFGTNVLTAASFALAAPLSKRFGLLNTMVFTHLPSNVLLLIVPLMPTFPLAAAVLLARFALSQMDVPTRQAYTMALAPVDERPRAAGLTNAVRPAAAAIAPFLSGLALQGAAFGLPFFLAGGLKVAYDLTLFATFRKVRL
jgi:MFS family permease